MNIKYLISFFIAITGIVACKQSAEQMVNGFKYTVEEDGSGAAAKTNEYVFFSIKVAGDDGSVIDENTDETNMPYFQIPEELPTGNAANPLVAMIKGANAKVGGVYKLTIPIDSIPSAKVEYPNLKHFDYILTVKKIMNEKDFSEFMKEKQAEQEKKAEISKAKIPEIETKLKETIAAYKAGKLETMTTPSGLKYYIVEKGTGDNTKSSQVVHADYYGALMDGTKFDDSFSRGQEFSFVVGVGQVIKGWDEGFTLLNKGAKAFLFIPADLAYGEAGSPPVIPGNAELVFYVELNDITSR